MSPGGLSTGGMIALPSGAKVYTGGRAYIGGEIPAHLCPEKFRPASEAKKPKVKDADQSAGAGRE